MAKAGNPSGDPMDEYRDEYKAEFADSTEYTEFEDDYGNIYYLDDGGNLRRRGEAKWPNSPKSNPFSESILRFLVDNATPEPIRAKVGLKVGPFKPSPVPDTLREWVEGKK